MTIVELRDKLQQLSDDDFRKFVVAFGGDHKDPESVVRDFVDHPEGERRLCHILHLPTQEERAVQAAMASASSAEASASSAKATASSTKWLVVFAAIAAVIALISVGVTIYGVCK